MFRFLVNPTSGGGRAKKFVSRLKRQASKLGAELHISCSGSDLTAQARRAVEDGVDRLIVAGGDGSVHLVVQSLADSPCVLGILPCGRGDDLASSLCVPAGFDQALELSLAGLPTTIDLGRARDRWFALYGGGGFDSACTETANRQPRWWPDKLTYVIAVLRTVLGFQPPTARVEWQGGSYESPLMFVTACNAPRFGGGMIIAPSATLCDGQFDLVIVKRMSKIRLMLQVFPRVFRGTHVSHPAVEIHRTPWARIAFDREMLLGCDGELVGRIGAEPLELSVRPDALKVIAGEGFTA